eukprot:TRINITY_DN4096_c0_g1_i1.p1 TRINITY_DN4096_c0_g1~~TRINITY_DN4096_c0_g1_i1.p1  ORF type:complete len:982 (+),score=270.32 TRINITY_DN4096_c0_g1_i1:333-3278(+)
METALRASSSSWGPEGSWKAGPSCGRPIGVPARGSVHDFRAYAAVNLEPPHSRRSPHQAAGWQVEGNVCVQRLREGDADVASPLVDTNWLSSGKGLNGGSTSAFQRQRSGHGWNCPPVVISSSHSGLPLPAKEKHRGSCRRVVVEASGSAVGPAASPPPLLNLEELIQKRDNGGSGNASGFGDDPATAMRRAGERQMGKEEDEEEEILSPREQARRAKISKANAGKVPWNKGRKWSEEMRLKIKARTAIKMNDPRVRRKIWAACQVRRDKITEEVRQKIRDGLQPILEVRRRVSVMAKNVKEDWRKSIAEAARVGGLGEEELEWQGVRKIGVVGTGESVRRSQAGGNKAEGPREVRPRAPKSEEHRRRIAEAVRLKWEDKEYRAKTLAGLRNSKKFVGGARARSAGSHAKSTDSKLGKAGGASVKRAASSGATPRPARRSPADAAAATAAATAAAAGGPAGVADSDFLSAVMAGEAEGVEGERVQPRERVRRVRIVNRLQPQVQGLEEAQPGEARGEGGEESFVAEEEGVGKGTAETGRAAELAVAGALEAEAEAKKEEEFLHPAAGASPLAPREVSLEEKGREGAAAGLVGREGLVGVLAPSSMAGHLGATRGGEVEAADDARLQGPFEASAVPEGTLPLLLQVTAPNGLPNSQSGASQSPVGEWNGAAQAAEGRGEAPLGPGGSQVVEERRGGEAQRGSSCEAVMPAGQAQSFVRRAREAGETFSGDEADEDEEEEAGEEASQSSAEAPGADWSQMFERLLADRGERAKARAQQKELVDRARMLIAEAEASARDLEANPAQLDAAAVAALEETRALLREAEQSMEIAEAAAGEDPSLLSPGGGDLSHRQLLAAAQIPHASPAEQAERVQLLAECLGGGREFNRADGLKGFEERHKAYVEEFFIRWGSGPLQGDASVSGTGGAFVEKKALEGEEQQAGASGVSQKESREGCSSRGSLSESSTSLERSQGVGEGGSEGGAA